jgi:hypothetical protein
MVVVLREDRVETDGDEETHAAEPRRADLESVWRPSGRQLTPTADTERRSSIKVSNSLVQAWAQQGHNEGTSLRDDAGYDEKC